jgi:hypothetical protein
VVGGMIQNMGMFGLFSDNLAPALGDVWCAILMPSVMFATIRLSGKKL